MAFLASLIWSPTYFSPKYWCRLSLTPATGFRPKPFCVGGKGESR